MSDSTMNAAIDSPTVGSVTTLAPVSLSERWNYVGAQVFLQPARQRTTRRASYGAATALRSREETHESCGSDAVSTLHFMAFRSVARCTVVPVDGSSPR